MDTERNPIIGIDLGTTNSLVAYADERGPRVLEDEAGRAILPSVVRFDDRGEVVSIGVEAREQAIEHPRSTVSSVKRLMGRSLRDASADIPLLAYDVVEGPQNTARIRLPFGGTVSAEEVSSIILRRLRDVASAALGTAVSRAVITVPAYFDDAQRQATRTAARLAGLEAVRIINEPTAAALAYGIGRSSRSEGELIGVFDFGGGTFDISILQVHPGEQEGGDLFQVLATAGDTRLGGDDIDRLLMDLVIREAQERFGTELRFTPRTHRELRSLAERAKMRLSNEDHADLRIELEGAPTPYERRITREEFESLAAPVIDRTIESCRRALRDAKLGAKDVDRVVMVGGSTRIPLVQRRVAEFFGAEPYTALDPDLVVAMGAAVQASIISGEGAGALLFDVVPLSLGIETVGGAVAKLIMRNSTVPARATEMFSTSVDGQTSIKLNVVQGEREMVEDCRSLGVFHLAGIPPMPAGIPQLEVEFLVDVNGVLNVSASERRSGKRMSVQIVPNHGLSEEEVSRLEKEAFTHAREDMERHRVVDLIANSRLDLKWIDEGLARVGDRLAPEQRDEIRACAEALRSFIERAEDDWSSVDANEFHRAKEALDRASVPLHELGIAESLRSEG